MRKQIFTYIFTIVVSLTAISMSYAQTEKEAYLAIIIDDFGYDGEGTKEMLALDIPLTAAIMPFSECTEKNCKEVFDAGMEAIIHLPMESKTGKRSWVGTKGVFTDMTADEIKQVTEDAFAAVNTAVGVNNHMGSAIMENREKLEAVMDVVAEKNAVFIDSLTTGKSTGKAVAEEKGVSFLERTMFIDCPGNTEQVVKNIISSAEIAKKNGYAVAIGHVGPAGGITTAEAIKRAVPEIEKMGVKLVTVSELNEYVNGQQ